MAKMHKYTIMEAIKIQEICELGKKNNQGMSASFWQNVERKGSIPSRTGDSMRNFLKTKLNYGLETFL